MKDTLSVAFPDSPAPLFFLFKFVLGKFILIPNEDLTIESVVRYTDCTMSDLCVYISKYKGHDSFHLSGF